MFENNKYLLTFGIIALIVLFSYLVYKIIKTNETIKEAEEERVTLNNVITSRDATIKQLMKKNQTKKQDNEDQETDYITTKKPLEVFTNKGTEQAPKVKSDDPIKEPVCNTDMIHTSDCRPKTMKTSVVNEVVNEIVERFDNDINNSPIIDLSEDTESLKIIKTTGDITQAEHEPEDSISTSSIIDKAIRDVDVTTNIVDTQGLSENIYEEEEKSVYYETEELPDLDTEKNTVVEDVDEEEEDVDEEDVDIDEEEEEEDVDEDEVDIDEEEEEDVDEEIDIDEQEDEEEEDVNEQEEDVNEQEEDVNEQEDEVIIEEVVEDLHSDVELNHDGDDEKSVENDSEFIKPSNNDTLTEESIDDKKDQERDTLSKMNIKDLKKMAQTLSIKLSYNGHALNKSELIEKILEA